MNILNAVKTVGNEYQNVIAYNGIIDVGDMIKVCIVEDNLPIEKIPIEVIKNDLSGVFEGKLLKIPVSLKEVKIDDVISFNRDNIYSVHKQALEHDSQNYECVFDIQK